VQTNVLCAECFGIIPQETDATYLMLKRTPHHETADRQYCENCSRKFFEFIPENTSQYGKVCSICAHEIDIESGFLQVHAEKKRMEVQLCPECLTALSRSIEKLKERAQK
jgi:hypothetical protein